MTVDVVFYGVFVASKVGKTSLTPTVDVDRITRSDGTIYSLVTAGSAAEIRNGLYCYRLAAADLQTYDYTCTFKTADATVDAQHVHAMWSSFPAAYATELARLDAAITTRLAAASYTTPPTAAAISDQVWDEAIADHASAGSTGKRLTDVLPTASYTTPPTANAVADQVWDEAIAEHQTAGTTGEALAAVDSLGSGTISVVSPVADDGDVETYMGDDYLNEDGRALDWTANDRSAWPSDISGATITIIIDGVASFTGSVVVATGTNKKVRLELTRTQSASIKAGVHPFRVIATQTDADVATLVRGSWTSNRALSAPST